MRSIKMKIKLDLTNYIISQNYTYDQIINFMVDLDVEMCDPTFTEGLILSLIKSLNGDLNNEERTNLIERIQLMFNDSSQLENELPYNKKDE